MNVREWALPVYTILMQLSVGTLLLLWIVRAIHISRFGEAAIGRVARIPLTIIFLTTSVAMVGSHFHLSKPFRSFLAVLNFRTSWLSREIVFTVLFFLAVGCLVLLHWLGDDRNRPKMYLGWLAICFGLVLVYCMSQIYLLPTQSAWNSQFTILSFFLTMLFLGCLALPAILLIDFSFSAELALKRLDERSLLIRNVLIWCPIAAAAAWIGMVAITAQQIQLLRIGDPWAQTSFELVTNLYLPLVVMRLALPLIGIIWLTVSVAKTLGRNISIKELTTPAYISCIFVLVGEILGRFLFYAVHIRLGV
jgi:anaerobic dimethyl sulfoxide reductase subunit C (anchor subunit)